MNDCECEKASNTGNSRQYRAEMGKEKQASKCQKLKRRKTDADQRKSEAVENNKLWPVRPEIMEDMGVGKLVEDSSENSGQNKSKGHVSTKKERPPLATAKIVKTGHIQLRNTCVATIVPSNDSADASLSSDFFRYRRMKPAAPIGKNMLDELSDEIVLMIFHWLPKQVLVRIALVCKRWQRIVYDDVLWSRIDLGSKVLKAGSLSDILSRGVVILRMTQTDVNSPLFHQDCPFRELNKFNKLQFLDLSMAIISSGDLSVFLKTCRSLHKLSLEHCSIKDEACYAIAENSNLEVLNLSSTCGVSGRGISRILLGCRRLSELNLAWASLSSSTLDAIGISLPRSLQRLNISGCRKFLTDRHVRHFVRNCPNLVELDLSDCTNLTSLAIDAICCLNKLEHVAFNRCYNIPSSAYFQLSSISTLMYLDVMGLFLDQSLLNFEQNIPNIGVNKFLFSSIARPTVGIRRTSIWGLKVRDC